MEEGSRGLNMKKQMETCVEIEEECINCIWKGTVKAEKRGNFLHWKCPWCGSRYCLMKPGRIEEYERVAAEGIKAA